MTKFYRAVVISLCCLCLGVLSNSAHPQNSRVVVKYENKDVAAVAFSRDGKVIAYGLGGSSDNKDPALIELREAKTRRLLHELHGPFPGITSMAFSPDSRWVAATVAARNRKGEESTLYPEVMGEAYLWDAKTGKLRHKLSIASGHFLSIAFSPNSRSAAIGSGDTTIRLWDFSTGKSKWVVGGQARHVNSVAFSPDGKEIATGNGDKGVRILDASTGKLKRVFTPRNSEVPIDAVAFSPQGSILASAGYGELRLWNPHTGKMIRTLGQGEIGRALLFSPNGKLLAVGYGGGVILWDVSKGRVKKEIETQCAAGFDFTPDGKYLAISDSNPCRVDPLESVIVLHKL